MQNNYWLIPMHSSYNDLFIIHASMDFICAKAAAAIVFTIFSVVVFVVN